MIELQHAAESALDKKAEHVLSLDLTKVPNRATDFMLICSCSNFSQALAIAENIEANLYVKYKLIPRTKEGFGSEFSWILLNYIDFFIHIFNKEKRYFYDLESLWGDAIIRTHG